MTHYSITIISFCIKCNNTTFTGIKDEQELKINRN